MALLGLRQAAATVGVSRQTVYRLVKEGKLSATVGHDGQKVVDTAELLRVFGRLAPETAATVTATGGVLPRETPQATAPKPPPAGVWVMTAEDRRREVEIADREALRAELAAAREALEQSKRLLDEAKEREGKLLDLLAGQGRLLEHKAAVETPKPRGFWRRAFGKD